MGDLGGGLGARAASASTSMDAATPVECTPPSPVERVTVFPNSAEVTRRIGFEAAGSSAGGQGKDSSGDDVEGKPDGCPAAGFVGFIDVVVRDVPSLHNTSSLRVRGSGSNVTILGVTMRTPRYLSNAARGRQCGPTRTEAREADPVLAALVKQDKEAHAREMELSDEAARVQNEVKALDAAQRSATTDATVLGALLGVPPAAAAGSDAAARDACTEPSCSSDSTAARPSATHLLDLLTALSARRAGLDQDFRGAKAAKALVAKERAALARRIAIEKQRVDSEWERQNDARRCNPEDMEDRMHAHVDVVVSVEVGAAPKQAGSGAPQPAIESLDVTYLVGDAHWVPSYEVRFDTAKSTMELVYYGNVAQDSGEDWEGAVLQLSTSDPSTREGPPSLPTRHVRWGSPGYGGGGDVILQSAGSSHKERKTASMYNTLNSAPQAAHFQRQQQQQQQRESVLLQSVTTTSGGAAGRSRDGGSDMAFAEDEASFAAMGSPGAAAAGAEWAMPTMVGGGGHGSPALFEVSRKATIASTGRAHKLTLARLHMPSTLTHIVRPAVSRHAFVRATTVNSGSMPLLPSHDVGVFVDGSFVADSHLAFVNPGERFKTWLGEDPAVRVQHVAPRSQHAKSGLFTEAHHQTYKTVTTITNMRGAASSATAQRSGPARSINLIVAQQLPRSTDDAIKVHVSTPAPEEVRSITAESRAERHTEDADAAGIDVEAAATGGAAGQTSKGNGTGAEFAPGIWLDPDSSTVEWRRVVAPGASVVLPFEYSIEWPSNKHNSGLVID